MAARKGKKLICPNCGWENFARATKCQVCTCPLVVGASAPSPASPSTISAPSGQLDEAVLPGPSVPDLDAPFDANWLSVPGVTSAPSSGDASPPTAEDPGDRHGLGPPSWQYTGDTPPAEAELVGEDRKDFWHLPVFDPLDPLDSTPAGGEKPIPHLPPPPKTLPPPPVPATPATAAGGSDRHLLPPPPASAPSESALRPGDSPDADNALSTLPPPPTAALPPPPMAASTEE